VLLELAKAGAYSRHLNILLINILVYSTGLANSTKVCIAMKVLELVGKFVSSQFTRLLFMIISFYHLVMASIEYLRVGRNSCFFFLFNQPWFIRLITDQPDDRPDGRNESQSPPLKEELLIALILVTSYVRRNLSDKAKLNLMAQEVFDVASRIIKIKPVPAQGRGAAHAQTLSLAIGYYLLLLEEGRQLLSVEDLDMRLSEVVRLVNQKEIEKK